MIDQWDKKLSQEVSVVLVRLPELDTGPRNIKPNVCNEKHNNESFKMAKSDSIKNRKCNASKSCKKEKKCFQIAYQERKEFLKEENSNYYSSFVKSEKKIDSHKNNSPSVKLLSSDSKEWLVKGTKIKKETKESLKGIVETNISNERHLHKSPYLEKDCSENIILIRNQVEPLIDLIPPIIKSEEPEIRTIKKIHRNSPKVIEIERETGERGITFTPSIREVITKNIHKTVGIPNELYHQDIKKILKRPRVENVKCDPKNKRTVKSSHQTKRPRGSSTTGFESCQQIVEKSGNDFLEDVPKNKDTYQFIDQTSNSLDEEVPKSRDVTKSRHKLLESPGNGSIQNSCTNSSAVESSHQTLRSIDHSEVLQEHNAQNELEESTTASLEKNPTLKSGNTLKRGIKVKAPQALGIPSQDDSQQTHSVCTKNDLIIFHLSQIRSTTGNESKIADICKVYPLFFNPNIRCDISTLIQILHIASRGLTVEQLNNKHCDNNYPLNIRKYSRTFVQIFKKILKLDQIGSDKDLLKKIIPILYLQIDKAFKRLRPEEDFDFRIIMKKMFEAESFVCEHDVILERNSEMFHKVMATFNRWLEDIFIENDLSNILGPEDETNNVEADGMCGQLNTDSLEEIIVDVEHDNLLIPEQHTNPNENARKQETYDSNVDSNYLLCPLCMESLPLCCICKELLSCPCAFQLDQTKPFDRGPESLSFCKEHSLCGDNWWEWEESWKEHREEDHKMPLHPMCWNVSCSKTAKWLCICRVQAYCSHSCQVEHWNGGHHETCVKHSDPKCLLSQEDMDVA